MPSPAAARCRRSQAPSSPSRPQTRRPSTIARVRLEGIWRPEHTVFLDNRQMKGRPGFFVVTAAARKRDRPGACPRRGENRRSDAGRPPCGQRWRASRGIHAAGEALEFIRCCGTEASVQQRRGAVEIALVGEQCVAGGPGLSRHHFEEGCDGTAVLAVWVSFNIGEPQHVHYKICHVLTIAISFFAYIGTIVRYQTAHALLKATY